MCGRYDLSSTPAAIRAHFKVPEVPEFAPNPDLRPTDRAPIVRVSRDGVRECVLARWGLVPAWAKDLAYGSRCFNARSETAATLPSFRGAFRKRRCLVPVDAFYEWTGERGRKTKWRIACDEPAPFALAGLWEWWRDPEAPDASAVETYTILTTAANSAIAPLHERMPALDGRRCRTACRTGRRARAHHRPRVSARRALALLALAGATWAQGVPAPESSLDTRLDPAAVRDCGSVVVQRCEAPAPAPAEAREAEARRSGEVQSLERAVVEGERLRGPQIERLLAERLGEGIVKPGDTREVLGNDGSRCTCMRRCPPPPFACCNCSVPPDRPTRNF